MLLPALLPTVRFTVYVPALGKGCVAFADVGVVVFIHVPSPNDQFHEVGVLVDVSLNCTQSGAVPVVGVPVKQVTAAGATPHRGRTISWSISKTSRCSVQTASIPGCTMTGAQDLQRTLSGRSQPEDQLDPAR